MNFLASADAKPRLKWTAELHQNFITAINQLGGPDKATPRSLMTVMGIPGLTLYHLKSHLQKYRLGKNQQSETSICSGEEDAKNIQSNDENLLSETVHDGNKTEKIPQALQMQIEVQRRLHEQIKVQRHLQVRIEAQGKYLQSILKRAQESLSGYCSSSRSVELAKAELSKLASMVNTGCNSFTKPAEIAGLNYNNDENDQTRTISKASSFELSEISEIEEEKQQGCPRKLAESRAELSLLDIHGAETEWNGMKNHVIGAKRSGSTISYGSCSDTKMKKFRLSEMIDLNS